MPNNMDYHIDSDDASIPSPFLQVLQPEEYLMQFRGIAAEESVEDVLVYPLEKADPSPHEELPEVRDIPMEVEVEESIEDVLIDPLENADPFPDDDELEEVRDPSMEVEDSVEDVLVDPLEKADPSPDEELEEVRDPSLEVEEVEVEIVSPVIKRKNHVPKPKKELPKKTPPEKKALGKPLKWIFNYKGQTMSEKEFKESIPLEDRTIVEKVSDPIDDGGTMKFRTYWKYYPDEHREKWNIETMPNLTNFEGGVESMDHFFKKARRTNPENPRELASLEIEWIGIKSRIFKEDPQRSLTSLSIPKKKMKSVEVDTLDLEDYARLPPKKKTTSKKDTMDLSSESAKIVQNKKNMEKIDVDESNKRVNRTSVSVPNTEKFLPDPRLDASRKSRNIVKKTPSPLDIGQESSQESSDINPVSLKISIPYCSQLLMKTNEPSTMKFQTQPTNTARKVPTFIPKRDWDKLSPSAKKRHIQKTKSACKSEEYLDAEKKLRTSRRWLLRVKAKDKMKQNVSVGPAQL